MSMIASSFACARQRHVDEPKDNITAWARRFIAQPTRTPAEARHQQIVADLLAEAVA